MTNKALYILAGYDDKTENYLSNIQKKLYEQGFIGTHTKNIPQHITLGSFSVNEESMLIDLLQELSKKINFKISLTLPRRQDSGESCP